MKFCTFLYENPSSLLLFIALAFSASCSEDKGYDTLNGTWTVETSGFLAEFTISKGSVGHSLIQLKGATPGEFVFENDIRMERSVAKQGIEEFMVERK